MKRFYLFLTVVLIVANMMGIEPVHDGYSFNIWAGTQLKSSVRMTCYPAGEHAPAVIVCPGGSYFWHARNIEGHEVCKWLQQRGISAFTLEYRVAGINAFIYHTRLLSRGRRYPDMMEDVQRAISILRSDPDKYMIDPSKLGVMGFSAGGHLALMSGVFFDTDFLKNAGVENNVSLRPDFIAPIYPVVSMSHEVAHKRSRRGLIGENRHVTQSLKDSLSIEKHVRPDMPPVFLMNCKDDPTVKWRNSELLDSALTRKGVPHKYILFNKGGHGFGMNPGKMSVETSVWPDLFIDWLTDLIGGDFIKNKGFE